MGQAEKPRGAGANKSIRRGERFTRRESACAGVNAPANSRSLLHHGVGRGCGVGRGLGNGVGLGVGVTVDVGVAVTVGLGVGVGVALGVGVGLGKHALTTSTKRATTC